MRYQFDLGRSFPARCSVLAYVALVGLGMPWLLAVILISTYGLVAMAVRDS